MPDDTNLEKIAREAGENFDIVIRAAYEAGRIAGEKAGLERAAKAIAALGGSGDVANIIPVAVATPAVVNAQATGDSLPAGAVIARPVREAMRLMQISGTGASPRDITIFMQELPGLRGITEPQVRAALRALTNRKDIERVGRGRYRAVTESKPLFQSPIDLNDAAPQEETLDDPEPEPIREPVRFPSHNQLFGSVSVVALTSMEGTRVN
jgi:hypothetical protein